MQSLETRPAQQGASFDVRGVSFPPIAWAPATLLVFGIGDLAIIAAIFSGQIGNTAQVLLGILLIGLIAWATEAAIFSSLERRYRAWRPA